MTPLPEGLTDRLLACAYAKGKFWPLPDRQMYALRRRGLLREKGGLWLLTPRGRRYVQALRPLLPVYEGKELRRMVEVNLRRARLALDETQARMATAFGVHLQTYGRWERLGRMPHDKYEKLQAMMG